MIEYILGLLVLIPPAIDDYKDYLVSDWSWVPTLILLGYLIYRRDLVMLDQLYIIMDFIMYLIVFIPLYLILKHKNMEFGEADLILYLVLIMYEPIINLRLLMPDYLVLILIINVLGLIYGSYQRIRGKEDKVPLVAMSLPALILSYIIILIKALIPT